MSGDGLGYNLNKAIPLHTCMAQKLKSQCSPSPFLEDDCLLQSDCRICYLQYDSHLHYPMLVCSSQHTICFLCFQHLSRKQQFIHCPFCKRASETEAVVRFRFALSATAKYRALREKYLVVLDRLQAIGGLSDKQEYRETLMDLERTVRNLSDRLKSSEDTNRSLLAKMEEEKERYRAFEQEIIECKHNDILVKNRLTMAEYDLRTAEREKFLFREKLADAKREMNSLNLSLIQARKENQTLREEMGRLMKGEEVAVSAQGNSEKKCENMEDSPEMQHQCESPGQQLFILKQKSKSEQRLKTELPPSTINNRTTKRISTVRKTQGKWKGEDGGKLGSRKIQKVVKF